MLKTQAIVMFTSVKHPLTFQFRRCFRQMLCQIDGTKWIFQDTADIFCWFSAAKYHYSKQISHDFKCGGLVSFLNEKHKTDICLEIPCISLSLPVDRTAVFCSNATLSLANPKEVLLLISGII